MTKTVKPKKPKVETKEARFIRFPPVLDAWLAKNHSESGYKNVNQYVVDLVRREWQQNQTSAP